VEGSCEHGNEMLRNFLVTAEFAAPQEGLSSMKLVTKNEQESNPAP
jgi:hypothetical protein